MANEHLHDGGTSSPLAVAAAASLLVITIIVTMCVPARSAGRIDPARVLRGTSTIGQRNQTLALSMRRSSFGFAVVLAAGMWPGGILGQSSPQLIRVPMRDGITLAADVWLPDPAGRYPVVLMRTPYPRQRLWRIGALAELYTKRGYVLVTQDVRGRGDSEGSFGYWFQESDDGYDTIEWIARQPWSNGRVGMMGSSYLGSTQWMAARSRPPHLVCIVPTAATPNPFLAFPYVGGMLDYTSALNFAANMTPRPTGTHAPNVTVDRLLSHRPIVTADIMTGMELPLYREWLRHPTLDAYWRRYAFSDAQVSGMSIPIMLVTGWWDVEQQGLLSMWPRLRDKVSRNSLHLTIGPWTHEGSFFGDTATVGVFRPTAEALLDMREVHLQFFDRYLRGDSTVPRLPAVRIFVTGANSWRTYDAFPPSTARDTALFLRSGVQASGMKTDGSLSWTAPGDEAPHRYTYDPRDRNPVGIPATVSNLETVRQRDDILVYVSEPLTTPLEVIGQIRFELHAASDARDTDWVVYLFEVLPDGRVARVGPSNLGMLRARYRNGFDNESLLERNKPELFRITLPAVAHRFAPGSRLRLEIASSAAPRFDRNPNTGNAVATDTAAVIAHQSIFHDRARPSRLLLPVIRDFRE